MILPKSKCQRKDLNLSHPNTVMTPLSKTSRPGKKCFKELSMVLSALFVLRLITRTKMAVFVILLLPVILRMVIIQRQVPSTQFSQFMISHVLLLIQMLVSHMPCAHGNTPTVIISIAGLSKRLVFAMSRLSVSRV